jgi:hypothetical protein
MGANRIMKRILAKIKTGLLQGNEKLRSAIKTM